MRYKNIIKNKNMCNFNNIVTAGHSFDTPGIDDGWMDGSPEKHEHGHEESLEVAVPVDVRVVIDGHFTERLRGEESTRCETQTAAGLMMMIYFNLRCWK